MDTNIFGRVKYLCDVNDVSINKLEKELGLGTSTISKWKTQSPSSDKLVKVANYFSVSTDYLIGLIDDPYKIETTDDPDLLTIQRVRKQMSDYDKDKMMKLLKLSFEHAFREGSEHDNTI